MDLSTTFASIRKQVAGLSLVALVAGLFAAGVATAATENIFSDVPADAWYAGYVNDLAVAGVIDSTKDMYRPGDLVNRAEMAKFAFMVSGLPLETASAAPYKDVAMGQWYTNYIYTLTKNGIVSGDKLNGVPTGWFRPEANLNRAEAAKMLVNSAAMAEDVSGAPHFPDVASGTWYFNFVETAFNNGVVSGYPDGMYRPANFINRAEAAKMVFLSMNPVVAGFTLDSAAAASKTTVELIFSMNVDSTLAADKANYTIEDSSGVALAVSAAAVTAADTVMLTTATQTAGKVYYVTAKNLESDNGDLLANTDSVSFLGYGADVTGGALEVALSTQTPVAGSIPSGATGVVFTCWDFMAGSSAATVKSLTVHRVGPGAGDAFSNLYLYNGDARLTTGRSLSSETQTVEFNNINVLVGAGENVKLCLVADLDPAAPTGGVHAFELANADAVSSNSSNMTGSFPLRGADQLITSAVVGSTKVKKNGSLDEVNIGTTGARIAQFEIEAGSTEDQQLERIALYVRGRVTTSSLTNLKLYALTDASPLATAASVGANDLATFSLATPFKIGRGQSKIFYVTADIEGARTGDDIKVYIDETTDVLVTGLTYGYGTQVNIIGTVAGNGYDGVEGPDAAVGTADDNYSYVLLKGSKFMIGFTGPVAGDLPINQKQTQCLAMTITNSAGLDVTIKDWMVDLTAGGIVGPTADGLLDTTAAPTVANYTLIKLVRLNDDGTVAGTLLGSGELSLTGSDVTQAVKLTGTTSIASGESIKAAIVFDVANNAALSGNTIKCSLQPVTGADMVKDSNNDMLGAANITPSSTITGNTFTVVTSALDFTKNSSPSNGTKYAKGTNLATLYAFQAKAGSTLDTTIKSLAFKGDNIASTATATVTVTGGVVTAITPTSVGSGYTVAPAVTLTDVGGTCTTPPTATAVLTGDQVTSYTITNTGTGLCGVVTAAVAAPLGLPTTDIKDIVDSLGIYDAANNLVSDLKSFPASTAGSNTAVVTFNNLDITVLKNTTANLYLKGTVSNSLTQTAYTQFAFDAIPPAAIPLVIDQNGQTVTGVTVANVEWGTALNRLNLILGQTPTVTPSVTASNDPKMYAENTTNTVFAFTMKATDGAATLQDLIVKVATTTGTQLPVESIALYSAASSGACTGATLLKDYESVVATTATTGYVKFVNINKSLLDSQNTFFCVNLRSKSVVSGQPVSNSDITLNSAADAGVPGYPATAAAIIFSKVQDQSGATLVVAPIVPVPAIAPSVFFAGVPTFASQALPSSALTTTSEVMKFTAGSIGNVNTLEQLSVLLDGQAAADVGTCELYRADTLIATSTVENAYSASQTLVTFLPADFVAGGKTWSNGSVYTIKCAFAALVANDSVQAKLIPIVLGAPAAVTQDSAIMWDDGNLAAAPTDAAFAAVDTILFFNNVVAAKLTAV